MQKRSITMLGTALTALTMIGLARPIASAQAQTPQQYVVVYGEFRPDRFSIQQGTQILLYLTHLANQSAGVVNFASYTEIQRANFFSLIELWQDAATYTAFLNSSNTQKALGELQPFLIAPLDERDGNLVE
jgi:quinol monooxygenase YgiN